MKIIAAIQKAPFTLDAEYDELCSELIKINRLICIRKIENLRELQFWHDYDSTAKIIWFENASARFDVQKVIQALSKEGVNVVVGKRGRSFGPVGRNQVLGFKAGAITLTNNQICYNSHHLFPFNLESTPDTRKYQVYTVAHRRPEYLKLSLSSAVNAFSAYKNVKINLVINEDRGIFDSVLGQFPTVNVIRFKENHGFRTLRYLVENGIIEKGIFFYFEDDFILPVDLEISHPLWAREFYDMAANGGYVGWRAAIYPREYCAPSFWGNFMLQADPGKKWVFNFGSQRILTGYGFAIHTDSVIRASQLTQKITDEFLTVFSRFEASPTLVGHHLGINKEIDYP